jgi:hypothetical protein
VSLKLKKIIENIVIKGLFPEAAYLYDKEKKHTFKTLDFDHTIWTNSETRGEIIRNGAFAILALSDDKVEFIDDTNGEIVSIEDFRPMMYSLNQILKRILFLAIRMLLI